MNTRAWAFVFGLGMLVANLSLFGSNTKTKKYQKNFNELVSLISTQQESLGQFKQKLNSFSTEMQVVLLQTVSQKKTLLHYASERQALPVLFFLTESLKKTAQPLTFTRLVLKENSSQQTFLQPLLVMLSDQECSATLTKLNQIITPKDVFCKLLHASALDGPTSLEQLAQKNKYLTAAYLYSLDQKLLNSALKDYCKKELACDLTTENPLQFRDRNNETLLHYAARKSPLGSLPFFIGLLLNTENNQAFSSVVILSKSFNTHQTFMTELCENYPDTALAEIFERVLAIQTKNNVLEIWKKLMQIIDATNENPGAKLIKGKKFQTLAWLKKKSPPLFEASIKHAFCFLKEAIATIDNEIAFGKNALPHTLELQRVGKLKDNRIKLLITLLAKISTLENLTKQLSHTTGQDQYTFIHDLFSTFDDRPAANTIDQLLLIDPNVTSVLAKLLQTCSKKGTTPLHIIANRGMEESAKVLRNAYDDQFVQWANTKGTDSNFMITQSPLDHAQELFKQACLKRSPNDKTPFKTPECYGNIMDYFGA